MPSSPTTLKVLVFAASLARRVAEPQARRPRGAGRRAERRDCRPCVDARLRRLLVRRRRRGGAGDPAGGARSSNGGFWTATRSSSRPPSTTPRCRASLKNLIDWTSRFRPQPFDGRHGLLLSASPSLAGGNRGLWALAHAARAPRRAHLPGHVLAFHGPQGVRRRRSRRRRAASALREEPAGVPLASRGGEALPLHQERLGRVPRRAAGGG